MEERRERSKKGLVVAWSLTLGLALAVGPLGSPAEPEECGSDAACAPTAAEMGAERLHVREWRGRRPEICLVNACDARPPTFCPVGRRLPIAKDGLRVQRPQDPCEREPNFRTARTRR